MSSCLLLSLSWFVMDVSNTLVTIRWHVLLPDKQIDPITKSFMHSTPRNEDQEREKAAADKTNVRRIQGSEGENEGVNGVDGSY